MLSVWYISLLEVTAIRHFLSASPTCTCCSQSTGRCTAHCEFILTIVFHRGGKKYFVQYQLGKSLFPELTGISVAQANSRKTKKPWVVLKMTKMAWNAIELSVMVSAANSHVSPKTAIRPPTMTSSRTTPRYLSFRSVDIVTFFIKCLTRTVTTIPKIMWLKRTIANIGPRKAPKKTPVSPMKQLQWKHKVISIWQTCTIVHEPTVWYCHCWTWP